LAGLRIIVTFHTIPLPIAEFIDNDNCFGNGTKWISRNLNDIKVSGNSFSFPKQLGEGIDTKENNVPKTPKTSTLTVITTKKKEKRVMISVETKKGHAQLPVSEKVLSNDLLPIFKKMPDDLNNEQVKYEMDKGLVSKVWKHDGEWQGQTPKPSYANPRYQSQAQRGQRHQRQREMKKPPRTAALPEAFHNPYNFVPALRRDKINNELGDAAPKGHHAYHPNHWSGWVEVELKTATPLLIPDAAQVSTNREDHKTFPIRVDANGAPYLPPTSLKGMLRAAYETVTNSRFGVFEKHDSQLAYRMDARKGVEMIPALVEKGPTGLQLRLLPNSTSIGYNGAPQNGPMYAAWLPRYQKYFPKARHHQDKHESERALRYSDKTLPQHGNPVWVRCEEQQHRSGRFSFLTVTAIQRRNEKEKTLSGYQPGIVCITGRNMMNKHEERVFLLNRNDPRIDLLPRLLKGWETLVENYQKIHADDLQKRKNAGHDSGDYLGHEPGKTGWSRHIEPKNGDSKLKEGSLCYARVERQSSSYKLLGLYPVMISRDLFNEAPKDLLHSSLHPAADYPELSPADRVFGWVNQHKDGKGAWKGQLRIEPATCEQSQNAIERFGKDGVPLAILGEAKPQQTHFYVAHNWDGEPLLDGSNKAVGYQNQTQSLRGRKVYPHPAYLAGLHEYWLQPRTDRTQQPVTHQGKRYYQEYRRPTLVENGKDKTRDNQNRSILGWVKPDTTFHFKIHVSNLSEVELGGLLWLLNLDENSYHRLGSAKPLGFGSVRLKIKQMEMRNGESWQKYYQNFLSPEKPVTETNQFIDTYKKEVTTAYKKPFDEVPFIKAFKVALRGFDNNLPVHYPRLSEAPNPKGESFKWFVENDRKNGPHLALPALEKERGLPLLGS